MIRALLVCAVLAAGCDPLLAIADSEAFGGDARAALAARCCACLARAEVEADDPEARCPAEVGDAGALDAGEASPCLCGALDAATCAARLQGGAEIVVVGACVRRDLQSDGACTDACSGVLGYVDETAVSP